MAEHFRLKPEVKKRISRHFGCTLQGVVATFGQLFGSGFWGGGPVLDNFFGDVFDSGSGFAIGSGFASGSVFADPETTPGQELSVCNCHFEKNQL